MFDPRRGDTVNQLAHFTILILSWQTLIACTGQVKMERAMIFLTNLSINKLDNRLGNYYCLMTTSATIIIIVIIIIIIVIIIYQIFLYKMHRQDIFLMKCCFWWFPTFIVIWPNCITKTYTNSQLFYRERLFHNTF